MVAAIAGRGVADVAVAVASFIAGRGVAGALGGAVVVSTSLPNVAGLLETVARASSSWRMAACGLRCFISACTAVADGVTDGGLEDIATLALSASACASRAAACATKTAVCSLIAVWSCSEHSLAGVNLCVCGLCDSSPWARFEAHLYGVYVWSGDTEAGAPLDI